MGKLPKGPRLTHLIEVAVSITLVAALFIGLAAMAGDEADRLEDEEPTPDYGPEFDLNDF